MDPLYFKEAVAKVVTMEVFVFVKVISMTAHLSLFKFLEFVCTLIEVFMG